jgi:hypothetical protein
MTPKTKKLVEVYKADLKVSTDKHNAANEEARILGIRIHELRGAIFGIEQAEAANAELPSPTPTPALVSVPKHKAK